MHDNMLITGLDVEKMSRIIIEKKGQIRLRFKIPTLTKIITFGNADERRESYQR